METSQWDLRINQTGAVNACMLASLYYFDKKFTTHFRPTFTLNRNTRVGRERCSRFIKVTSKTRVNCFITLDRFEQILHLVWVFLWPFFKKQVNFHCGIGSISMLIASHIYNAANHVIAKNNCQNYFKKFEVLLSRK